MHCCYAKLSRQIKWGDQSKSLNPVLACSQDLGPYGIVFRLLLCRRVCLKSHGCLFRLQSEFVGAKPAQGVCWKTCSSVVLGCRQPHTTNQLFLKITVPTNNTHNMTARFATSKIVSDYIRLHPKSLAAAQRARKVIAGGVAHDIRHLSPFPLTIQSAKGVRKVRPLCILHHTAPNEDSTSMAYA